MQVWTLVVLNDYQGLRCRRSHMHHPPNPGSQVAPPHLKLQLLQFHLQPVEPPHMLILHQRGQEMETQTKNSPLSAPYLPPSSPPVSLILQPPHHLLFPLNLQSPAVLGLWQYSFDEPGREHAKASPHLLQSSLEIRCCWRAASRSAAWPESPDPGIQKQPGALAEWSLLHLVSDPEGGG